MDFGQIDADVDTATSSLVGPTATPSFVFWCEKAQPFRLVVIIYLTLKIIDKTNTIKL